MQVEYPETQKLSLLLMHDGGCEIIGSVELAITEVPLILNQQFWGIVSRHMLNGSH